MNSYIVGPVQTNQKIDDTGRSVDVGAEYIRTFFLTEAKTPEDAVGSVAEDKVGTYVVLAVDLRGVATVVV